MIFIPFRSQNRKLSATHFYSARFFITFQITVALFFRSWTCNIQGLGRNCIITPLFCFVLEFMTFEKVIEPFFSIQEINFRQFIQNVCVVTIQHTNWRRIHYSEVYNRWFFQPNDTENNTKHLSNSSYSHSIIKISKWNNDFLARTKSKSLENDDVGAFCRFPFSDASDGSNGLTILLCTIDMSIIDNMRQNSVLNFTFLYVIWKTDSWIEKQCNVRKWLIVWIFGRLKSVRILCISWYFQFRSHNLLFCISSILQTTKQRGDNKRGDNKI